MSNTKKKVYIISCGPGGVDYITPLASKRIEEMDIVVGAERVIRTFASHKPSYVPEFLITDTLDFIGSCKMEKIGVLVTGDAGFFSLSKTIKQNYKDEVVEVISGVSAMQVAFSRIKQCWHAASFFSVHGRSDELPDDPRKLRRVAILCDHRNTPDTVLDRYKGLELTHDVWIMEELTTEQERVREWYPEMDLSDVSGNCIIVITTKRAKDFKI